MSDLTIQKCLLRYQKNDKLTMKFYVILKCNTTNKFHWGKRLQEMQTSDVSADDFRQRKYRCSGSVEG